MTTEESNKLIAEFMGDEVIFNSDSSKPLLTAPEYHTSWDWLMPVVEKIELLENNRFSIEIYRSGAIIHDDWDRCDNWECWRTCKLESMYSVLVQFIQWYNQQNQTT